MIKTNNLDKIYNKGKSNSIHVIDNTSLEFPETGFVSLVGQSGSGKTTLLNVISGLDKANGLIEFDDIKIDKYKSGVWDKIRSNDIGYVFQNYYLFEDKSVYENIALTLRMIGIVDETEVEYRVHYVLDAVGMYRFRKKKASDLSGGQKQRVAIARAIAKNPKVVIADEPTGNLDTLNSVEVMKIIRKISEERLVILVTHNIPLANKYSDRIITLSDGKVLTDLENTSADSVDLNLVDENIYLKDLNNYSNDEHVNVYSNSEINDLGFTLVKINNVYYLKTNDDNVKVNVITPSSKISILDESKANIKVEDGYETDFSLDELDEVVTNRTRKRTLSFKESLIEAIKKLSNLGRKGKVQLIALVFLGIFFSMASFILFTNLVFDDSEIYTDPLVYQNRDSKLDLGSLDSDIVIFKSLRLDMFRFTFKDFDLRDTGLQNSLPLSSIKESDLILGEMPKNKFEVIIDSTMLDSSYGSSINLNAYGINSYKDLLGQELLADRSSDVKIKIVGIVKTNTKTLYLHRDLPYLIDPQLKFQVTQMGDDIELFEGRMPDNSDITKKIEVISLGNAYDIGELTINDEVIVGKFGEDPEEYSTLFLTDEVGYNRSLDNYYTNRVEDLFFYSSKDLTELNKDFYNIRENTINIQKTELVEVRRTTIVQMVVTLVISGVIFFFLVRSSLTKRVKEVSIYRSLGVSRYEVLSLFGLEYFILTLSTSVIGVLIGALFSNSLNSSFLGDFLRIKVTPLSLIITILAIIITNIIIALIPVFLLLRKTPATMLTAYDI